MTVYFVW